MPTLPTITFFHTDNCEKQAIAPIATEAAQRGFPIQFATDLQQKAEIGVYCQHACQPNADLSVIMFHDLAQRHDIWPKFWAFEPWNRFDIGLLPGPSWVERWQTQADWTSTRPRLGVFDIGWPKADLAHRNRQHFAAEAARLRDHLGLKHERSILYAPSWENHGKQDDFVKALRDLPVNLLLKQAPWSDHYPMVLKNIADMNALHRGCADNVYIVDPEVSIMYCLGLADLLVSDESSVLVEALLLDVPGVAVTDWLIPDTDPPRPACMPLDFVCKTTRSQLRQSVENILAQPSTVKERIAQDRQQHFSHLGDSSRRVVDLLLAAVRGEALPHPALAATVDLDRQQYQLAEKFLADGRSADAEQLLCNLAIAGSPCWEVYNDLASIFYQRGEIETATSLFQQAADCAPDPVTPLANLTELHCASNNLPLALATAARLSAHLPRTPQRQQAIRTLLGELLAASQP